LVAPQLYALRRVDRGQPGQEARRDRTRHQQRLHGVADAEALGLRVVRDADRFLRVGLVVYVDVAHAVQVLDHGDTRIVHQPLDQAFPAARHDYVHVVLHRDQLADRRAIGGLDHLDCGLGQPGCLQALVHAGGDRLVGVQRFRAAAQYGRVAGLDAEPGGVGGHVRTRFVDDAHHAYRHAHLAYPDAGRALPDPYHLT